MKNLKMILWVIRVLIAYSFMVIGLRAFVDIIRNEKHTAELTVKDLRSLIAFGVIYGSIYAIVFWKKTKKRMES